MSRLNELAFYTLAGQPESPRELIDEVQAGEAMGFGSTFISERFNIKEAATLSGATGVVTQRIGIATAATNHNTRHPMVTASYATTMHRLTDGRFTLGLGKRETSAGEIIRRGDVFGWAPLVEGHAKRIATAYCLTACEVFAIDGAALMELMESDFAIGYALMKKLAVLLTSELVAFAAG